MTDQATQGEHTAERAWGSYTDLSSDTKAAFLAGYALADQQAALGDALRLADMAYNIFAVLAPTVEGAPGAERLALLQDAARVFVDRHRPAQPAPQSGEASCSECGGQLTNGSSKLCHGCIRELSGYEMGGQHS